MPSSPASAIPERLSEHRHPRCAKSREEIARALHGSWREEQLFALEQVRHRERIAACDRHIDEVPQRSAPSGIEPTGRGKRDTSPHPFAFDARGHCFRLAGVDLTTVGGVGVNTVLSVLAGAVRLWQSREPRALAVRSTYLGSIGTPGQVSEQLAGFGDADH